MWKGRFGEQTSNSLQSFGESVSYDSRLFAQDIRGSIAHARALKSAGILTGEEFQKIETGLREIERDIREGRFEFRTELEDVHMNIESELTRRIGAAGAKLHTARSRNDQVATDIRLYLREATSDIRRAITALQTALLKLASENPRILIPGYTHLQRAQPVYFAHHLLAYLEMLERDKGRLSDAAKRFNLCPLGSGAIAGSTIALDREQIAAELGFDGVTQNSMDAVGGRDFACEVLSCLAILGMHLSRLSEDVILWVSTEFSFLRLSDAHTTGSSLMPQKKNPDIAELVRGKSGRLYGNLLSVLTTCKGLPMTYNRDLQEDKEPLFDSIDTCLASLSIFAEMMSHATIQPGPAADAVRDPLLLATDIADALVKKGVPFRLAHEKVGKLVARAEALGTPLNLLPEQEIQESAPEILGEFSSLFDLHTAMESRTAPGAPSPGGVQERIAWWQNHLPEDPAS